MFFKKKVVWKNQQVIGLAIICHFMHSNITSPINTEYFLSCVWVLYSFKNEFEKLEK